MEQRKLGSTGLEVSVVSLGSGWLGREVDVDEAIAVVHAGFERGINLIDTSPLYGDSERRVGLALEAWFQSGGRREDLIVCTKTGTRTRPFDYSAEATRHSIAESLKLLKVDYLDVVHVHDPASLDPVLATGGALEALLELKQSGVVRHIGLGVRELDLHEAFHRTGHCEVSLTYRDFNLLRQQAAHSFLPSAASHGVGVVNAQVVFLGLLAGDEPESVARWFQGDSRADPESLSYIQPAEVARAQELWSWCRKRDIDLLDLGMQYALRDPRISTLLVGATSIEAVTRDCAAVREPIPDPVWTGLREDFGLSIP